MTHSIAHLRVSITPLLAEPAPATMIVWFLSALTSSPLTWTVDTSLYSYNRLDKPS